MSLALPRWARPLVGLALFCTLLPLWKLSEIDLRARQVAGMRALPPERYHVPPPAVLRALSFGYNELVADLLWVRTIAYFADHLTTDHDLRYLERHLNNILALDPRFKQVYRYGAAMLMSQGERQTNEHVMAAIQLLERGHALFPDEWRFPLHIGAYYMSELRSPSRAQRNAWRLEGARWIHKASLVGSTIPWLPSLAANVYTEQGQRDLAILRLQELYLTARTEETKQQIAAKLRHLRAQSVADETQRTDASLAALRRASPVGFLPVDLFVLVGLPEQRPFSLEDLVSPAGEDLLR